MNISYIDELTLDFAGKPGKRSQLTLYAKQEDSARCVQIKLQNKGEDYRVPDGVSVSLRALKPDGKFLLADCPHEGYWVYLTLPRQMLTVVGCVRAEICLTIGEEVLSSATFYVEVVPMALSAIASENDLSALSKAIDTANALLANALADVAVETVTSGSRFDPGAISPNVYQEAPTWEEGVYHFPHNYSLYSNSHAALNAGWIYFITDNDPTSYCKLVGENGSCTGYIRYRPLGTSGGLAGELRSLLDGNTVEGRALPTATAVAKLGQLMRNYTIVDGNSKYCMISQEELESIRSRLDALEG